MTEADTLLIPALPIVEHKLTTSVAPNSPRAEHQGLEKLRAATAICPHAGSVSNQIVADKQTFYQGVLIHLGVDR